MGINSIKVPGEGEWVQEAEFLLPKVRMSWSMTGGSWWQQNKVWSALPVMTIALSPRGREVVGTCDPSSALGSQLLKKTRIASSLFLNIIQDWVVWECGTGQYSTTSFSSGEGLIRKKSWNGTWMPVLEGNCREQRWKSQKQGEQMRIWWTNPVSRTETMHQNWPSVQEFLTFG